jgi:hypothetical protein
MVGALLKGAQEAGAEIATHMKLSEATESLLGLDFISPNV